MCIRDRCERRVVTRLVVADDRRPDFAPGARIECDEYGLARSVEHLVAVERHAAIGLMRNVHAGLERTSIAPEQVSALHVDRDDLVVRTRYEHHATVDQWRGLM